MRCVSKGGVPLLTRWRPCLWFGNIPESNKSTPRTLLVTSLGWLRNARKMKTDWKHRLLEVGKTDELISVEIWVIQLRLANSQTVVDCIHTQNGWFVRPMICRRQVNFCQILAHQWSQHKCNNCPAGTSDTCFKGKNKKIQEPPTYPVAAFGFFQRQNASALLHGVTCSNLLR